jgi:hypothetical protein
MLDGSPKGLFARGKVNPRDAGRRGAEERERRRRERLDGTREALEASATRGRPTPGRDRLGEVNASPQEDCGSARSRRSSATPTRVHSHCLWARVLGADLDAVAERLRGRRVESARGTDAGPGTRRTGCSDGQIGSDLR